MEIIKNRHFEGERPLFESHNLRLEQVTIGDGESAIKECSNIEAEDCRFWGKYPFWHVHGFRINRCQFDVGARSALWYSDNMDMRNTRIDGPKMFREMHDLYLENVVINDADETSGAVRTSRLATWSCTTAPIPSCSARMCASTV